MRRLTATRVRVETIIDDYGDTTTVETQTEIRGCLLAPRTSTERVDSRSPAVITGASLYLPATAEVPQPADHFLIDGRRYEQEGEAGVWPGRGIEVAVKTIP